ncbi:hypothetical protein [Fimbriiglobus ruber]|uniref:VWFA domain-containing protein n=1 Tax=Fimbriiglobus ruber TaxID=1908690 RepID=A0A225DBH0_9BACT|nr:hypothetical protein [Fimbriiglobus ruber]OWK34499.1 hypothetical protein FRUB_10470 [Fimbriiglobus ruber]
MFSKQIDRANPGCIVFLADQSNSMLDGIGGSPRPKIEVVATALNRFFGELVAMCEKGEDLPRHWFDVGLVGYTTDANGNAVVKSLYGGGLAGLDLVGIPKLYESPLDVERRRKKDFRDDGAGGLTEVEVEINFPVWYRPPTAETMFGTPMCAAFTYAHQIISNWIATHPDSFPPMVINLTDGEPTDGDPEPYADQLKNLSTSDGNLLLFNCHLSGHTADPVFLPTSEGQLPDDLGKALFRMSSSLPDKLRQMAEVKGISAPLGCKATAFNADAVSLLKMLSVGTVVAGGALPKNLR